MKRRDILRLRRAAKRIDAGAVVTRAATRIAYAAFAAYARRLPGFRDSSFSHLWANLLATPAMMRIYPSRIEVKLTPPPLNVIWKITGADRATYRLPTGCIVRVEAWS